MSETHTPADSLPAFDAAASEVVEICRDLIRIDTQNWGEGKANPERPAADRIVEWFAEVGLETEVFESEPGRATTVTRFKGSDPDAGALVVHGHTDVVPADASEWSVDPFSAEIRDGLIYGRGAVDMKDMDAMIISVVRQMAREGIVPRRDLLIVFFADEEAGGGRGSQWMVEHHPEVFAGATEAISEVGGYSVDIRDERVYLIQTAEKGLEWLQLTARGTAGHGSQRNDDNPITHLAGAVSRIGAHVWPQRIPLATEELLRGVAELTGIEYSEENIPALLDELGTAANFVEPTLRSSSNPTLLAGGYKHNVIPSTASALIDARPLPGDTEDVLLTLKELAGPNVEISPVVSSPAVESPNSGPLVDAMKAAILSEDPTAKVLPYALSGGTDNKALSELGIVGYGFAPLQLTGDLDFPAMFHGVDERVPVTALEFGARVLGRFLITA